MIVLLAGEGYFKNIFNFIVAKRLLFIYKIYKLLSDN